MEVVEMSDISIEEEKINEELVMLPISPAEELDAWINYCLEEENN